LEAIIFFFDTDRNCLGVRTNNNALTLNCLCLLGLFVHTQITERKEIFVTERRKNKLMFFHCYAFKCDGMGYSLKTCV